MSKFSKVEGTLLFVIFDVIPTLLHVYNIRECHRINNVHAATRLSIVLRVVLELAGALNYHWSRLTGVTMIACVEIV